MARSFEEIEIGFVHIYMHEADAYSSKTL